MNAPEVEVRPFRSRTPAKICGLTRPEDADAAVQLGASALGVIFAGGPRLVDHAQARAIVKVAGGIPVFGVFGSQGHQQILETRDATGLTGAQLHGGATPDLVDQLNREGLQVLVVVHLGAVADLDSLAELAAMGCPLLIEPRVPGRLGGTGVALPLSLAADARQRLVRHPMWLAGGLTPENVAEAVRFVRPDAVDVSSGVEQIPGIKDHQRMARFLEVLG
jgi:phosphoribosylanthranilate isomerase